jgi:thiamine transporter ThiT
MKLLQVSSVVFSEPILVEVRKLSIQIAILRYDIREGLLSGVPLGIMHNLFQEVAILQEQKLLLELGRFKELPYNIRHLYS